MAFVLYLAPALKLKAHKIEGHVSQRFTRALNQGTGSATENRVSKIFRKTSADATTLNLGGGEGSIRCS